jgi:hypothetical protein
MYNYVGAISELNGAAEVEQIVFVLVCRCSNPRKVTSLATLTEFRFILRFVEQSYHNFYQCAVGPLRPMPEY